MANDQQTVPRTVWKGQLTLGLLALPVRFVTAARKVGVELNQLHATDLSRLKQKMFCEHEDKLVAKEEIVKGYEIEDGKYVIVTADEIKRLAPATEHVMEAVKFVFLADVDPIYFDQSYYLEPGEGGEKAYALLYAVMRKAGCCAVTRIAMHNREHVAILRPGPRGIVLQTLFYHDEIRSMAEFRTDVDLVSKEEIALAEKLVESRLGRFEAEKYQDTFRQNVLAFIQSKKDGTAAPAVAAAAQPKQLDVLEALRQSIAQNSR